MNGRALIIGGGIGGLAAAKALERAGIDVMVFEQSGALREIGAGVVLASNAVKALSKLGLLSEICSIGSEIHRMELRTWRGKILSAVDFADMTRRFGAPTLCLHRADLIDLLSKQIDQSRIQVNAKCVGFEKDTESATAYFISGIKERGAILIGADGLHSAVREQILGKSQPRYCGYTCWRGIARLTLDRFPPGIAMETWGRGQRFGLAHLSGGRIYWYATRNMPEGGSDTAAGRKPQLLDLFKRWHEPIEAVIEATPDSNIFRNDIYDRPATDRWGEGRVTLLGDAAHPTTPNLGQGACQAIEDAVVLAGCLSEGADEETALRKYEKQRMARTARVVDLSRRLGAVSQWQNPLACWLRDSFSHFFTGSLEASGLEWLLSHEV